MWNTGDCGWGPLLRWWYAAPLDYKYAEYKDRTFRNHKYQLTFYGELIREHYQVPVNRGFIVYTRSRNKLIEVPITDRMYSELDNIIKDFLDVVEKGVYPKPTKYAARCGDCCYRNICEKVIWEKKCKYESRLTWLWQAQKWQFQGCQTRLCVE